MKPVVDVAPRLEAAATAIADARWADAATELLAAWQDCRSERIARLVAAVDLRLPAPAPLEGKLVKTREQHWHQLVLLRDDESIRRALAAPWPTNPKPAHLRLDALRGVVSARVSNALLALHRSGQYISVAGTRLSRAIFHLLVEQDDHAVVAELDRLASQTHEATRLGAAVLRRRRPALPYLSPAAEAALGRIEQLVAVRESATASTRDNLLAAIYAAPADDGPRLVYADVLTEAGDPRGEFITLQLVGNDARREAKLLEKAGRSWLDGLDQDGATRIGHRRGFPASASLGAGEIRAPAWATIEKLHLINECELAGGPQLRALRELYGLGAKQLATAKLPSYELDVLTVRGYENSLGIDTPFSPRILGLSPPHPVPYDTLRGLREHPIARRLETVRLGASLRHLQPLVALVNQGFAIEMRGSSDLERQYQWAARITPTSLRLHWAGSGPYGDVAFESVFPILEALPAPAFQELEITGEAPGLERVRDALIRVVQRWPRLRSAQILDATVTN